MNNKQTKEYDEKRRLKNEKRRLWRMKKKAMRNQGENGIGIGNCNTSSRICNYKGNVGIVINKEGSGIGMGNGKGLSLHLVSVIPSDLVVNTRNAMRNMENDMRNRKGYNRLMKAIDNYKSKDCVGEGHGYNDDNKNNEEYSMMNSEQRQGLITMTLASINKDSNSVQSLNQISLSNQLLYSDVSNEYWTNMLTQLNTKHLPKYPIEDSELYSNPILHSLDINNLNKPKGKSIPFFLQDKINQLMLIWDFCQTFSHKLNLPMFSLCDFYLSLQYTDANHSLPLITSIHSSFIYILLNEIAEKDYQSLQSEGELMLLKLVFDNLSSTQSKIAFAQSCWIEIAKLLIQSNQFNTFLNDELKSLAKNTFKEMNDASYNNSLNYPQKVLLLQFLLGSAYETKFIRDVIKSEQEKRNELRKIKRDYEEELRMTEGRKRELERQEKYTRPMEKVEALTKKLQTLSEDHQTLTRKQLARMRKEIENEREKFKSVIKESDQNEHRCNDIISKIEKIQAEIGDIPSMNKKCLGIDGMGNKYFFFPWERDKLYIRKGKEWTMINTNDTIKELISSMCEKGIHEKNLLTKLHRIYPKKLKCLDNDTIASIINDEKSAIEHMRQWTDNANEDLPSAAASVSYEERQYTSIVNELNAIEAKVTDYLSSDNKEWESFDIRVNIKAWIDCIRKIPEYAKLLLLWNERCKNPYKIKVSGNKMIIEDEYEGQFSLIDNEGRLDVNKINPSLELGMKTKLWSREFETLALEDIYLEYLSTIESFGSLTLAINCFNAVCDDLVRRREYYRRRGEDMVIDLENEHYPPQKSLVNDNNADEYNEDGIGEENKKEERQRNKAEDDDDREFEVNEILLKESYDDDDDDSNGDSEGNDGDYGEGNGHKYKSRLRKINKLGLNKGLKNHMIRSRLSNKRKEKMIEWNETCMFCKEFGELICCEDCPNVTHLSCADLSREPEIWRCSQCIYKLANRRITRSHNK